MQKRKMNLVHLAGCHGCLKTLCKYNNPISTPSYSTGIYDMQPYGCNSSYENFVPLAVKEKSVEDEY